MQQSRPYSGGLPDRWRNVSITDADREAIAGIIELIEWETRQATLHGSPMAAVWTDLAAELRAAA